MIWQLKLLAQFALARLPRAEQANFLLGALLRPGAHGVASLRRLLPLYLDTLAAIRERLDLRGATVFELGTGWCPLAPTLMHLAGVRRISTWDHVPHLRFPLAKNAIAACRAEIGSLAERLRVDQAEIDQRLRVLEATADLESLLRAMAIDYHAPADGGRTGLPSGSVDLWYSYSVLENVPQRSLGPLLSEAARLLRPHGVFFSVIGCQDPFASGTPGLGRVHYLKYSDALWNFWTSNRLAHNNRLRERDFVERLTACGLPVAHVSSRRDPEDVRRLASARVAARFAGYTPEELAVHRSEITAVRAP